MTKLISDDETLITDQDRWSLIRNKASEVRACTAFDIFRHHGIEPILIKGISAGQFYPTSKFRDSVDMDLAVTSADFDQATVIVASPEAKGLAIDLHRELRHLDTLPWSDLFLHSELITFETGTVRVLRPEDHLRVLCVHWLTDGGANKDRLWDIYYLIANRRPDFDWDRFLNTVDTKRRRWLICTIGLAQRFLDLDLTDTPVAEAKIDLPLWMISTVEKEWLDDTPLRGLYASMDDRKMFWKQVKKRLPPNPIAATVLVNGSFDAKTRVFYQIGTTLERIGPSIINIAKGLYNYYK